MNCLELSMGLCTRPCKHWHLPLSIRYHSFRYHGWCTYIAHVKVELKWYVSPGMQQNYLMDGILFQLVSENLNCMNVCMPHCYMTKVKERANTRCSSDMWSRLLESKTDLMEVLVSVTAHLVFILALQHSQNLRKKQHRGCPSWMMNSF